MSNCKNCRRWDADDWICNADWVTKYADIGAVDFAIFAEANDDHGLVAGLKTGPMFGCVRFQVRPENIEE